MSTVPTTADSREPAPASLAISVGLGALSLSGVALFLQAILESTALSLSFVSYQRWQAVLGALGGRVVMTAAGPSAVVSLASVASVALVIGLVLATFGAILQGSATPTVERFSVAVRRLAAAWFPA